MSTTLQSGWIEPDHGSRQKRSKTRHSDAGSTSRGSTSSSDPAGRMEEWNSVLSLVSESADIERIEITFSQAGGPGERHIITDDDSSFVDQVRDEYQGEGLVAVDTVEEYVIAVASSWEDLDDQFDEIDYNPDNTLTLRCYE